VLSVLSQLTVPARDKAHVEWVKAFTAIFDDLKKYVMEYHSTGLVWNAKARKVEIFPNNT
jgi:adenylyl cyclase-associated protein